MQLVVNETPWRRGNLPEPRIPDQCPREVWDLIVKCTDASPSRRPPAKGQAIPIKSNTYSITQTSLYIRSKKTWVLR